ncbi:MAG TPA: GNAT family N-acetyltransferase [Williamwhitmania sp.]|nr:GNAT family N-acetyltransferase [Williamwhitmania sp.]
MFKLAAQQAAELRAKLVINPSFEMLRQVECWLKDEYENSCSGFYPSWDIIRHRFDNGQVILLQAKGRAVGFICWYGTSAVKFIDFVEVMPHARRRGLGRFMVEECLDVFREIGCVVVSLECPYFASLPFWRSLNFIPNTAGISCVNQRMFKVLTTSLELSGLKSTDSPVVELWNEPPDDTANKEATWRWLIQLENGSSRLVTPVIYPCLPDWRLRVRAGSKIFANTEVKHFSMNQIYFDGFLIIERLGAEPI